MTFPKQLIDSWGLLTHGNNPRFAFWALITLTRHCNHARFCPDFSFQSLRAPRVMQLNENCYFCLKSKLPIRWAYGRKTFRILKIWKGSVWKSPHNVSAFVLEPEKRRIREDPTNVHEHLEMESGSSWWCPMKGQGAMGTNGRTGNPVQVHEINR